MRGNQAYFREQHFQDRGWMRRVFLQMMCVAVGCKRSRPVWTNFRKRNMVGPGLTPELQASNVGELHPSNSSATVCQTKCIIADCDDINKTFLPGPRHFSSLDISRNELPRGISRSPQQFQLEEASISAPRVPAPAISTETQHPTCILFHDNRLTYAHLGAKPSRPAIMATEDERYRQSTQFRLWSFSPAQLAELRAKTNSLARQNISDRLSSSTASSSTVASANPSGSNTPIPGQSNSTPATDPTQVSAAAAPADVPTESTSSINKPPLPEFLTPAEEEQLLRFYTVECLRAAEFCQLPTEIRATSAIFLRRFFVTHSIMTYPPTKMLKTCLFYGSKAENSYPRVNSFAEKFPNTTGEEILAGEFLLCQGLRFAFDVRHPYRALEGAIMQLRTFGDVDVGH